MKLEPTQLQDNGLWLRQRRAHPAKTAQGGAAWLIGSAPAAKAGTHFMAFTASLKRCPDTNLEFFGKL